MGKFVLFSLAAVMILSTHAYAGGPGTTNANFLKAGQGVRPIAMGESYIALGNGLDTLYWNPAGLTQLQSPEATFTHSFWVQDIGTEYLAFGTPLGPLGSVGGGVTYMNAGTVTQTLEDEFGNYIGTGDDVSAMSLALIGTYAQKLSRLIPTKDPFIQNTLIGASLRIVSESIDETSVLGGAIDIGGIWRQTEEIKVAAPNTTLDALRGNGSQTISKFRDKGWRAGFVAQNLGMTTDQMMPINFRAGVGYLINDVMTPNGQVTLALDALIPVDNTIKVSLGGEYAYITAVSRIAIRLGYKIGNEIQDLDALAGFTAGAGFSFLIGSNRYQLDYAFVPYGDLGTTHRVSFTLGLFSGKNLCKPVVPKAKFIEHPKFGNEDKNTKKTNQQDNKKSAKEEVGKTELTKAALTKQEPSKKDLAQSSPKVDTSKKLSRALKRVMGSIKAGMMPALTFKKGSSTITKKSKRSLGQVGKQLERYPNGEVTILGFAGSNSTLALERADAALRYLTMNFRVHPERLSTKAGDATKKPKNSSIAFEVKITGQPDVVDEAKINKKTNQPDKKKPAKEKAVKTELTKAALAKPEPSKPDVAKSTVVPAGTVSAAPLATGQSVEAAPKPDTSKKLKQALKRVMGSMKAGMMPALKFERGTATITKKSKRSLGQIGKQLERYEDGQVLISGFAGSNSELAQKRAESALRYLKMNFRVHPERLTTKAGDAAKKPKNSSIAFEVKITE